MPTPVSCIFTAVTLLTLYFYLVFIFFVCVCLRENLPICLLVVETEEITKFRILKEVIRKMWE